VRDVMRAEAEADIVTHADPPDPQRPPSPPRPTAAERERTRQATAELEQLGAEAQYHRDRLALYHARVVSAKPASASRLRELQRTSAAADARLAHAKVP
jgi:hypothetical protein